MYDLIQILLSGIVTGCLAGLVGFTFTSIYNATKVINFAQGEFVIVGFFIGFVFGELLELPYFMIVIFVIICGGGVGLLTNLFLLPLYQKNAPFISMIILTMGLSLIYSGFIGIGTGFEYFKVPSFLPIIALNIGNITILPQQLLVIATTVIMVTAYWIFESKTMLGKALLTTGFNSELAKLLGIHINIMQFLAFSISGAMSGIVGLMVGPLSATHALQGLPLVVNGFIAAVFGGLGNPYGAIAGGIIIGILNSLVAFYLSPSYAPIIVISLLLVVLAVFPKGLFAVQEEF